MTLIRLHTMISNIFAQFNNVFAERPRLASPDFGVVGGVFGDNGIFAIAMDSDVITDRAGLLALVSLVDESNNPYKQSLRRGCPAG